MAEKVAQYICFFLMALSQTATAETYKWEQAVTLRGKIKLEKFYGPPNYGETLAIDQKVELPVLYTEHSFDVKGISYNIYSQSNNQHKVQLITHNDHLLEYDKCVKVTGTLFEAVSGHHHTTVLLDVSDIASCFQK